MPISTNRTLWPVTGGAVGVQPGWFPGHSSAFFYINLGNGTVPVNYSYPMQPVFQITGPNNLQYEGSWCLPQVPLPVNFTAKIGQNATIQIIETAQHGASLYNVSDTSALDMTWFSFFFVFEADFRHLQCVDITFADPRDVPEVNETNCVNTTNIGFDLVYSTTDESAAGTARSTSWIASIPLVAALAWGLTA